jgi:O-antigen ligase
MPLSVSILSVAAAVYYFSCAIFAILRYREIQWNRLINDPLCVVLYITTGWLLLSWLMGGAGNEDVGRFFATIGMFILTILIAPFIRWNYVVPGFLAGLILASGIALFFFLFGTPPIDWLDLSRVYAFTRNGGLLPSAPYLSGPLLGGFLLAIAGIYVWKHQSSENKSSSYTVLFCGVLGILALGLMITQSRGALLGLIIASFVFILANKGVYNLSARYFVFLFIFVAGIGLLILYYMPETISRLNLWNFDNVPEPRMVLYQLGISVGLEHPFWGIGSEGYQQAYLASEIGSFTAVPQFHAHNDILQSIVLAGIPYGLVIVTFLTIAFTRVIRTLRLSPSRSRRYLAWILLTLLLGLFVYGMTDYILFGATTGFLYWFVLGVIARIDVIQIPKSIQTQQDALNKGLVNKPNRWVTIGFMLCTICITVLLLYHYNIINQESGNIYGFSFYIGNHVDYEDQTLNIWIESRTAFTGKIRVCVSPSPDSKPLNKICKQASYTRWYPTYLYPIQIPFDTNSEHISIELEKNGEPLPITNTYWNYYINPQYKGVVSIATP